MALSKRKDRKEKLPALTAASLEAPDEGAVSRLVQVLLDAGIDGLGPLRSAHELAVWARHETGATGSTDAAVAKVARQTLVRGGVGGFVTGVGGFLTMPIALPANVVEFYIQATRMVGAIADLRGYDVSDPMVRTAILMTLVGSDADDVLAKAGLVGGKQNRMVTLASGQLPPAGLLMLNKAIGFRLMRGVGEKAFSRLGRGIPLAGGFLGGGIDMWMMKRIADHAMGEFPPVALHALPGGPGVTALGPNTASSTGSGTASYGAS